MKKTFWALLLSLCLPGCSTGLVSGQAAYGAYLSSTKEIREGKVTPVSFRKVNEELVGGKLSVEYETVLELLEDSPEGGKKGETQKVTGKMTFEKTEDGRWKGPDGNIAFNRDISQMPGDLAGIAVILGLVSFVGYVVYQIFKNIFTKARSHQTS